MSSLDQLFTVVVGLVIVRICYGLTQKGEDMIEPAKRVQKRIGFQTETVKSTNQVIPKVETKPAAVNVIKAAIGSVVGCNNKPPTQSTWTRYKSEADKIAEHEPADIMDLTQLESLLEKENANTTKV